MSWGETKAHLGGKQGKGGAERLGGLREARAGRRQLPTGLSGTAQPRGERPAAARPQPWVSAREAGSGARGAGGWAVPFRAPSQPRPLPPPRSQTTLGDAKAEDRNLPLLAGPRQPCPNPSGRKMVKRRRRQQSWRGQTPRSRGARRDGGSGAGRDGARGGPRGPKRQRLLSQRSSRRGRGVGHGRAAPALPPGAGQPGSRPTPAPSPAPQRHRLSPFHRPPSTGRG